MSEAASISLGTATRIAHRSLEALPRLARVFADDYREDELAELIGCLLSIYYPLERRLTAGVPAGMLGYRPRVPMLEGAATLLGLQNRKEVEVPALEREAEQWGAFYVVEGAALGGQLIHRRLQAHFPELPPKVLGFWHPHGDEIGERWRLFRRMADQELADEEDRRLAIASANSVFGVFACGLDRI